MIRYVAILLWMLFLIVEGGCAGTQKRDAYGNPYYATETQPVQAQAPAYKTPEQAAREAQLKKLAVQGAVGAGVGAIAAEASGGKAGKGALIGAGTNVVGTMLLDALSRPAAQPAPAQPYYDQAAQGYHAPANNYSSDRPQKKIVRKYDADGRVISEEEVWE